LTFSPHPRRFFQPDAAPFLLNDPMTRENLLLAYGADAVISLPFDATLSQLSSGDFIQTILQDGLKAQHIVVGQNFVFGHGRQGHVDTLMAHGFDVTALAPVLAPDGTLYSSTFVRQAIQSGDMTRAQDILGHPWSVRGPVIKGDQRGRVMGFPTANIAWPKDIILPLLGVYAVTLELTDQTILKGVASIGVRPTFYDQDAPLLEVHLFDFNGDLYGQDVTVHIHHFIRAEEKFSDMATLTEQIAKDCIVAKDVLR